ncbi:glycosyltransferase family 25 protein [Pelagibacterium sp. H642]|uniref:glycosyltransferase family 25 protein n=1 Tax=Pelagibacterium sp. H642 TaxID=1881069 RepID=UPI0028160438|nr:glycosyltransferase family 25 protein [Pelagibacterium sp. H642]WMT92004.1 glycosyltransferase family 25 protein [Pelagibacterium sp. H642]
MSIPIYYINLASRTDRRDFMEEQFARLGLTATRIEAVTPADIPTEDLARYCDETKPFYRRPNQLACSLSHEKVWRAMLDAGQPRAVVLEDDGLLSASLPDFLANLDDVEFDLLRFERSSRKIRLLPAVRTVGPAIALRPFRSTLSGRSGYVIGERAARLMLEDSRAHALGGDRALYDGMRYKGLVRYHSDPALCIQYGNIDADKRARGVGLSDLNSERSRHVFARRHPVRNFFIRTLPRLGRGVRNAFDHLAHLPKGITKERISFRPD